MKKNTVLALLLLSAAACSNNKEKPTIHQADRVVADTLPIKPAVVTDTTTHDTDDPAIWINPQDPAKSLILGTDKDEDGALYVFDLSGKEVPGKTIHGLKRPNNVDIEYGFTWKGQPTDIAVVAERLTSKIRVFSLPDMKAIDNGGIDVFAGESGEGYRDLMGIACYKNSKGETDVIIGRKNGPVDGTYLWQYQLTDSSGTLTAKLLRKFGKYSGKKEIEAIAVDDELGYIYYSDEGVGVRKYFADPEKGNDELALFAQDGFAGDHEGISIYNSGNKRGFIVVSDQQANKFRLFPREGDQGSEHKHSLLRTVKVEANQSDGSDVTAVALPGFPSGLFVAMSDNKTFHFYHWKDIAGELFVK